MNGGNVDHTVQDTKVSVLSNSGTMKMNMRDECERTKVRQVICNYVINNVKFVSHQHIRGMDNQDSRKFGTREMSQKTGSHKAIRI